MPVLPADKRCKSTTRAARNHYMPRDGDWIGEGLETSAKVKRTKAIDIY